MTRIVMNSMLMLKEDASLSTIERCTLAALLALNTFLVWKRSDVSLAKVIVHADTL